MSDLERDTYVALGVAMWVLVALVAVTAWGLGPLNGAVRVFVACACVPATARYIMRKGVTDRG